MSYFAFQPSASLREKIQHIIDNAHSTETLYPQCNAIILQMTDEMIDQLLSNLIRQLREGEKKNIAAKLTQYMQSTVQTILPQILNKATNDEVQPSIQYLKTILYHLQDNHLTPIQHLNTTHNLMIAIPLNPSLVEYLIDAHEKILNNQDIPRQKLAQSYQQFSERIIQVFVLDFIHTLHLGLLKRKATELSTKAMIKAIHIAANQIIPHLQQADLITFAHYYQRFFFASK